MKARGSKQGPGARPSRTPAQRRTQRKRALEEGRENRTLRVLRENYDELVLARERGEPLLLEWALPTFFDALLEFMETLGLRAALEKLPDPRRDPVIPLVPMIYCVFCRFLMGFDSFRELGDVLFRHPDLLVKLGFTIALTEEGAYPSTNRVPCDVERFSELLREIEWESVREILVEIVKKARALKPKLFRGGVFLIDSNQFRPAIRHEGSEQEDRVRDPEEKICVLLLRTPSALIPVDFRVAKTGTGGEGETTCGQALIESVFKAHGPGFIKEIRGDRGYLEGPWLAEAEERLGFRWVMGVRENMDLFADALGLSRLPDTVWEEVRPPKFDDPRARPKRSLVRFEALMTWEGYGKPLTAGVIRDVYPDAVRYQVIVTPETRWTADQIHERSRSRGDIEEFFCILTVHWGLGRKLLARRIDLYRALVSLMMLLSALLQLFEASGEERRTLKEYQNAFKLGATHLIVGCGGWFAVLRLHEVNALINRCGGEAGATGAREWGAEQTRIRSP